MSIPKNISFFKAYRTSLLQKLYTDENYISIGRVRFTKPPYEGLDLKLWKDRIYIEYNKYNDFKVSEETRDKLELLRDKMLDVFTCAIWQRGVVINILNKDNFPDTKIGMKLRADYYVLIADMCLRCFIHNENKF